MSEDLIIEENIFENNSLVEGKHFDRIRSSIGGKENKERLTEETKNILSRISYSNGQTGLIVGRVQSGKTLSFEAVTGLARDNQAQLIIILAGVSKILTDQTLGRVRKDFKYDTERDWNIFDTLNSLPKNIDVTLIQNIEKFNNPDAMESRKKGNIIVCMKDHRHIEKVTNALSKPSLKKKLKDVKALIIDDEADQYSLNTNPVDSENQTLKPSDDKPSTTYLKIQELRDCLPNHTYLGYTATPQAPLLISTLDTLSPDFAEIVSPGAGYIGLENLFDESSKYISIIENHDELKEMYEEEGEGESKKMPESLKRALACFLVGAAQGIIEDDKGNRSMLIHPSRLIGEQNEVRMQIQLELDSWFMDLEEREGERFEETKNLIGEAYDNLASTYDEIEEFDEILKVIINEVKTDCTVEEINSGDTATDKNIDWNSRYAFIIVAGQAMDRGTTVNGLTVTYLSRSMSMQNDTQMQRARFLGYKEKYLGLIRIYLDEASEAFYKNYIETQDDFMNLISDYRGRSFKEAKRQWKLKRGTKSCREKVVSLQGVVVVSDKRSKWSFPRSPHRSNYEQNNRVINEFFSKLSFEESPDSGDTEATLHNEITLDFNDVYEELLSKLEYAYPQDAELYSPVNYFLHHMYNHWDSYQDESWHEKTLKCRIIDINARGKTRTRKINDKERLNSFAQGKSIKAGYIGDAKIYTPEYVNLQVHTLDLLKPGEKNASYHKIRIPSVRLPEMIWTKFDLLTQSSDAATSIVDRCNEEDE